MPPLAESNVGGESIVQSLAVGSLRVGEQEVGMGVGFFIKGGAVDAPLV